MSLSQEQRARLNYAFAHHVITTFSNSKAAYVQPFLQPVNVDDVPDYHDVVERPMDLSTILKDLERNKYTQLSDVKASFDLMFNNCFLYNPSRSVSDVYMKGWNFQRAFWTAWSKKDHWINAHAAQLSESSEEDEESINSKNFLQDDEQATDDNESDGVTHEDDGTPESDRPAVRRSSRVLRQNEVTGNNIIGKPWKAARKKHGGKYLLATRKPARDHDVSIKRTRLARKAAIRSTLQDHVSDSAESSQDEQSPTHENQTEHEAQQSHPSPEPEENSPSPEPTSALDPLRTLLRELVTKQIDTTATLIIDNVNGEHTDHRVLLAQLCRGENHEIFHEIWEQKAMDKVSSMLVQEILVGGVEAEVGLALAETVTEQTRVFCIQTADLAAAFSRSFGG